MKKLPSRDTIEARGGAALSWACVRFPQLIGERYIGPANADSKFLGEYPLTPLRWRVSRTLGSTLSRCAVYPGNPAAGKQPKDFPTAGISIVAAKHLFRRPTESPVLTIPAVGWVYKDSQLLVAPIPENDLPAPDGTFSFAMRIGRDPLKITAGMIALQTNTFWTRGEVMAGDIVPVTEVPDGTPAY